MKPSHKYSDPNGKQPQKLDKMQTSGQRLDDPWNIGVTIFEVAQNQDPFHSTKDAQGCTACKQPDIGDSHRNHTER